MCSLYPAVDLLVIIVGHFCCIKASQLCSDWFTTIRLLPKHFLALLYVTQRDQTLMVNLLLAEILIQKWENLNNWAAYRLHKYIGGPSRAAPIYFEAFRSYLYNFPFLDYNSFISMIIAVLWSALHNAAGPITRKCALQRPGTQHITQSRHQQIVYFQLMVAMILTFCSSFIFNDLV